MSASRELVDGRYEIVRPLGRGGMGEVLLARQLNLDRLVVLKRAVDARTPRELRSLADEARVAARLHHPNIVSIFDVVDRVGDPVVVMELVVGVSLHELIGHAPAGLPVEVALAIAIDILRGLGFAHSARVVHRDVNPRNVMVTFAGTTKLIDFGISQWLDQRQATDSFSGTRGYMPPEQQRGEAVDGRADQYAAGITLREMLTGDAPGEHAREIAAPELAAIVARMCAEQASERYPSCGDVVLAIEDHLAARGIAATATHVERWASQHVGQLRAGIEQAIDAPRPRTRRATPHTVAEPGMVARQRSARVAFRARTVATDDAWLGPVIERMTRRAFRDHGERRFAVASAWDATAFRVELTLVRDAAMRIDAVHADDGAALASATGASIAECVEALAAQLAHELGTGLSSAGPDADETSAMHRLGAPSFETFLAYRAAIHRSLATSLPETTALVGAAKAIVDAAPAWAHAYALLALLEGRTTPPALNTLAIGLARADAALDPAGARLLAALQHIARSKFAEAYAQYVEIADANHEDVLANYCLVHAAVAHHRPDEATALVRRLHHEQPDLIFGVDLADAFRRDGRPAAVVESVIRDWVAAAPDNIAARVELARVAAEVGRSDEAIAHAREALLVNGERGDALPELFEAAIASEQYPVAQRVADRMMLGSPLTRARGRYRSAMVAVFEGRFAAGYDSVRRAIDEHRAFGYQSELVQCLELARSLSRLVGDGDAQRRFTIELADTFETVVGDVATAAATRYELALIDRRGAAPSIDEHLVGLAEGPARDVARRRMLRMAALADCGSPHKAVAAGFSAWEENTASLVALGLCAAKLREHELARRSLERATHQWSSVLGNQNCPYHAVLARFHLAGVRVELGDSAGARAMYESFLCCWRMTDRPIPEVAIAKQILAHI